MITSSIHSQLVGATIVADIVFSYCRSIGYASHHKLQFTYSESLFDVLSYHLCNSYLDLCNRIWWSWFTSVGHHVVDGVGFRMISHSSSWMIVVALAADGECSARLLDLLRASNSCCSLELAELLPKLTGPKTEKRDGRKKVANNQLTTITTTRNVPVKIETFT